MTDFISSLFQPLWQQTARQLRAELAVVKRTAKKVGFGLLCFQISVPLFLLGVLLFLTALFLELSHIFGFVGPTLWTAVASIGGGILFLVFGLLTFA